MPASEEQRMTVRTIDDVARMFANPSAYTDEVTLHADLAHLRANAPVSWVEVPEYAPFWAITKHADIMEIERANDIFTNSPRPVLVTREGDEQQAAIGIRTLIHTDDPLHRDLRAIGANWFRPKAMRALKDRADELAKRFVDRMVDEGPECDFVQQVAVNYPLYMIMTLLGVPESDFAFMLKLTQELFGSDDDEFKRGTSMEEQGMALLGCSSTSPNSPPRVGRIRPTTSLRRSPTPRWTASRCPISTPFPTTRSSPLPATTPAAPAFLEACTRCCRIPTNWPGCRMT